MHQYLNFHPCQDKCQLNEDQNELHPMEAQYDLLTFSRTTKSVVLTQDQREDQLQSLLSHFCRVTFLKPQYPLTFSHYELVVPNLGGTIPMYTTLQIGTTLSRPLHLDLPLPLPWSQLRPRAAGSLTKALRGPAIQIYSNLVLTICEHKSERDQIPIRIDQIPIGAHLSYTFSMKNKGVLYHSATLLESFLCIDPDLRDWHQVKTMWRTTITTQTKAINLKNNAIKLRKKVK